jgi:biotin carboxyl carrier protein
MKMENAIQADNAGTVTKILVSNGQSVQSGDPLVEIA